MEIDVIWFSAIFIAIASVFCLLQIFVVYDHSKEVAYDNENYQYQISERVRLRHVPILA